MDNLKARVAICVPSTGTWIDQTATCYGDLREACAINSIGIHAHGFRSSMISLSRNTLVRMALADDPTHIMWIDSDNTFPSDGLVRLIDHDKDMVGAFYNRKTAPFSTAGHLIGNVTAEQLNAGGLYKADVMPHGFFLVKADVYRKLKSPWYFESFDETLINEKDPDGVVSEDANFCRSALKAGYDIWCDTDLTFEVGHCGIMNVPCLRPQAPTSVATNVDGGVVTAQAA